MSVEEIPAFCKEFSLRDGKYGHVIDYVISKEPAMSPQAIEFLVALDMQYSGLNPESTLLTDEELARTVHLDVISTKKINILTMKAQAEFHIHIIKNQKEISDWLNKELERQVELFLSDLAAEDAKSKRRVFYHTLAEIFVHVFTMKNYALEEILAAMETLMPEEDLKKFFFLSLPDQVATVKCLFNRTLGCIFLFSPEGRLAAEFTGMYLALCDMQVLLTAELESDLGDSRAFVELVQNALSTHKLTGAFDFVFAESHALLALHLQLELFYLEMLKQILSSKARLELLEFRVDTLRSELVLDQSHHATGDAPDSMLVNFHELGNAFTDIYCECLIMSNISAVFGKIKDLGKQIFTSLHEKTFSQIFEQYPKTPLTQFSSRVISPVDCHSPFFEALYEAPWQKYRVEEPLALNGICAVSLLDEQSYLKKGDLSLGVCKWKGKCYALSSPDAMDKFGRDPHLYADVVHRVGHERPELILLLDLQDEFVPLKPLKSLRSPVHMMTCSKTCWARAERLPEEEELANAWSEWDKPYIPKPQIDTKNITTHPSEIQRDKDTQCAPMVDSEMQTMSDVSINTDTPAIKSPRLLSHVQTMPYWVDNLNFEELELQLEQLSLDTLEDIQDSVSVVGESRHESFQEIVHQESAQEVSQQDSVQDVGQQKSDQEDAQQDSVQEVGQLESDQEDALWDSVKEFTQHDSAEEVEQQDSEISVETNDNN